MRLVSRPLLWTFAAMVAVMGPSAAQAEFITFTFKGTIVDPIPSGLDAVFTAGDQMTMAYTFDSEATPSSVGATDSSFSNVLKDFSVQVRNGSNVLLFQASANLTDTLVSLGDVAGVEGYAAQAITPGLVSSPLGDFELRTAMANLQGAVGEDMIDLSQLPPDLLISKFSTKVLQLGFFDTDARERVTLNANITDLIISSGGSEGPNPVPEPSSLALASIGGCFLAAWRRRQVRQAT